MRQRASLRHPFRWPINVTQSRANAQWSTLALLRLSAFGFGYTGFFMAMDAIVLPTLVLMVAPEGAKNTFLGVLGLSGMIAAGLVQPMVGWYSDRTSTPLGRRVPFMLWGSVFAALGLTGVGFVSNYSSLLIFWVFVQVNASIGYGPFQALIRDLVPASRIGIASSLKILADGAGGVTLIAISGAMIGRYTATGAAHWLWITSGVIAATLIATAGISSITVLLRERSARHSFGRTLEGLRLRSGLHPHLTWFLLSRYLMIAGIFVFPTYGLFFLGDVVRVENPPQTLGVMIISIGGALVLSIYPAGWISDKIGRKPVVIGGAVVAAFGAIAILSAGSATQVVVIGSVVGASVGTILTASWALANELGTEGREGQHMGIVTVATIAGAASAKILGPGVDLLNLATPGLGYSVLLTGCAAAFLVAALLILPIKAEGHQLEPREESTGHSTTTDSK